jgi:hypothetical protein
MAIERWTPPAALSPQEALLMKRLDRVRSCSDSCGLGGHTPIDVSRSCPVAADDRSRVDRRSGMRRDGGASARGSASPKAHRVCSTEHLVASVAVISSLRYLHPVSANATVDLEIEVPGDLARLHLPEGLDRRLQALLDKQDGGTALSADEQAEAEGLVDLADLLTLLRLRSSKSHPAPG